MATGFRRKGAHLVGRLDETELQVVVGLLEQTRDFVAPTRIGGDPFDDLIGGGGAPAPDEEIDDPAGEGPEAAEPTDVDVDTGGEDPPGGRDPALERLLPPAHRTDSEQADEFRRLTEHGLRNRKVATLQAAIAALRQATPPQVALDDEQAQAVVVALTDVRLILGERLGLTTDEDADRLNERLAGSLSAADESEPLVALIASYDFLTWLQESITLALLPR